MVAHFIIPVKQLHNHYLSFFYVTLALHFSDFVLLPLFTCFICPSLKRSHYFSSPSSDERRRRPWREITPARLNSGRSPACLQGKQRCSCKNHDHSTPDTVSAQRLRACIHLILMFSFCLCFVIFITHYILLQKDTNTAFIPLAIFYMCYFTNSNIPICILQRFYLMHQHKVMHS